MKISFFCWHCGALLLFETNALPRLGFEIYDIVNKAGWYCAIDHNSGRVLVFCCKEHAEAEKIKKGVFRARPLGIKASNLVGA